MKNLKSIIIILFALLTVQQISAQKEIGIRIGTSFTAYNEARYSAMTKKYIQPKIDLVFAKSDDQKRQVWSVSYAQTLAPSNPKNLWYKVINPEVNYTYQRKVKDIWIGGNFQSFTLLNFPKNDKRLFGNNPISYTIANSLGVAVDYSENLLEKKNHRLKANLGGKVNLLSHVIRPIYGHPYPEHYIQEDVFTPTRSGIGKSILKSGKFRTLDKYQNMKVVFGVNYFYKDHLKIGVQYERNFQKVKEGRNSTFKSHDVMFGISYLY